MILKNIFFVSFVSVYNLISYDLASILNCPVLLIILVLIIYQKQLNTDPSAFYWNTITKPSWTQKIHVTDRKYPWNLTQILRFSIKCVNYRMFEISHSYAHSFCLFYTVSLSKVLLLTLKCKNAGERKWGQWGCQRSL